MLYIIFCVPTITPPAAPRAAPPSAESMLLFPVEKKRGVLREQENRETRRNRENFI